MPKGAGQAVAQEVSRLRCRADRAIGYLLERRARVVPDHLASVGWIRIDAEGQVEVAHRELDALPLVLPVTSWERDQHVRPMITYGPRPTGRHPAVHRAQPVGAASRSGEVVVAVAVASIPPVRNWEVCDRSCSETCYAGIGCGIEGAGSRLAYGGGVVQRVVSGQRKVPK